MRKKFITSIFPLLLLSIFFATSIETNASDYHPKCKEFIQNYDHSKPMSTVELEVPTLLCTGINHHEAFPGAHIEEINLAQHPDPVDNLHQPWTVHKHEYINHSEAEENVNGYNIFKITAIDSYELHLEDDFVENVDLNDVICPLVTEPTGNPKWVNNCNGEGSLGTNQDGNIMGFIVDFDKANKTIKWTFPGSSHEGWTKPNVYGSHPAELQALLNPTPEGDTTLESERNLELGINFKTKNIEAEAWSATVTSRVLIKDFTQVVPVGQQTNINNWEAVQAPADEPGEGNNYYWFPIGTTTTIWERDIEEIPPNVCTDLQASRDPNGTAKLNGLEYGHKLTVDNLSFENEIPAGTRVLWESDDPNGRFWIGKEGQEAGTWVETGQGALLFQQGSATTNANDLDEYVYYFGEGPVKVSIDSTSIDEELMDDAACSAEIQIPNIEPTCEELKVDHPTKIYDGTLSMFRATAFDNDNDPFPGQIHYSVDSGYGFFYVQKPSGVPNNPSPYAYETHSWQDVSSGNLWDKNKFQLDKSLKTPLEIDLASMVQTNAFGYEYIGDMTNPIDGSQFQMDMDTPPFYQYDDDFFQHLKTSVTVNPGDKVYFYALKPGTDVIHVKAANSGEDQCERDFSIVPYNICEDLFVNYQEPIYVDTVSEFSAKALNPVNDNFYGNITYSVDPEYGTFYIYEPNSPEANNSEKIKEYNSSIPVSAPEGGFCSDPTEGGGGGPEDANPGDGGFSFPPASGVDLKGVFLKEGTTTGLDVTFSILTGDIAEAHQFVHPEDDQIYEVPDWLESGIKPGQNPVDPSPEMDGIQGMDPMQMGQISVFGAGSPFDPGEPQYAQQAALDGSDFELKENALQAEYKDLYKLYGNTLTVSPNTKVYFQAKKAGENIIQVSANCTENQDCTEYFNIIEQPIIDYVCTDIDPQIIDMDTDIATTTLERNHGYELTNNTSFDNQGPEIPTSDFTTTQGILIHEETMTNIGDPNETPLAKINEAIAQGGINSSMATAYNDFAQASGELIGTHLYNIPDGETIYLITFNDATPGPNALTIKASDSDVAECSQSFTLIAESTCSDIVVNYYPSPFDSSQSTIFSVQEGDFGDYQGGFTFESNDSDGEFYFPTMAEEIHGNPYEFTQEQAAQGIIYEGNADNATITIYATGEPNGPCEFTITSNPGDEGWECKALDILEPSGSWNENDLHCDSDDEDCYQKFQIDVDTSPSGHEDELNIKWKIEEDADLDDLEWRNGSSHDGFINYLEEFDLEDLQANLKDGEELEVKIYAQGYELKCKDTVKFKKSDSDKPEIEKFIYDNVEKEWANLINLAGKDGPNKWLNSKHKIVSYLAVFNPGSAKSAEIWEEEIKNGNIEAENTGVGEFEYEGFAIIADKEIYYMSNDFDEDKEYEDIIELDKHSYWTDDEPFCDDLPSSTSKFCIETSENRIESEFKKGDPIEFKNTDEKEEILILYQMRNNTAITDDYCQNMIEEFGECGEEFVNEINFKAYTDDDFDDEMETGNDSATAIVICPYILTREGGDSFFHSAFDTGVDVAACYDIETCEGPCIKKKKKPKGKTTDTGAGDTSEPDQDAVLAAPTHDVCKISNNNNTEIEEYQNVLKNFSSSVCEMEVDVAKEWKEKYINKSIAANVEKLSRFSTQTPPENGLPTIPNNISNGVYVVDQADLTISGQNGEFIIKANGTTPAAQTYIVKGHDLIIESNIKYEDSNIDISNPKNIPSVAFIVIDGNIQINKNVKQLDGIYMAIDTGNTEDGKIMSKDNDTTFQTRLTINGSLIGNVLNIYTNRRAVGNPLRDEGSITIRYDERILLNTPPGLSDLFNLTQSGIAH